MLPCLAMDHHPEHPHGHTVFARELRLRYAASRVARSDVLHCGLSEFRVAVTLAPRNRLRSQAAVVQQALCRRYRTPVAEGVPHVFQLGAVFKIAQTVVAAVRVFVVDLVLGRRARANERRHDHRVNRGLSPLAVLEQPHAVVAVGAFRLRHDVRTAPNAAKVRYLVKSLIAHNGAPFFIGFPHVVDMGSLRHGVKGVIA